jgi:hypothetical protein
MSDPEQLEDLYRELVQHRTREAVERIKHAPPPCLPAHTAEQLETAAAVLAFASATYAAPNGPVAERLSELMTGMLAAAASFEHLADVDRHNARRRQ